ncbi:MAG: hypothetical protein HN981_01335 [Candidatus Pacebacteria bacterium]|jgi:death-on-curing family protein|nr:hypothetical protein [Candidatus Paceibacterota bacterium]MBT4652649.1 hypothetical protein [Candidatus Paceibacterota bacterium]MBT6755806.1 hypothetical protein [Candidatus Paceibacterota bacterium]MBT6921019.1 hypothetical protein [Candidatus Paceibacterota bacterium]
MTQEKSKNPKIWLSIPLCEAIYKKFRNYQAKNSLGEQLPPLNTRYPEKLESLIGSVKLKSYLLSHDIHHIGATYYVKLARSQVFLNGNKRMAVILTDLFFELNQYNSKIHTWIDLADLTLLVSEDRQNTNKQIIELIVNIFKKIYIKKNNK